MTDASQKGRPSPRRVERRYLVEFAVSMLLYIGLLLLTTQLLRVYPQGWAHVLLALIPLVAVVLLFIAVLRYMLHTDEMLRRLHVLAFAIAAGATAFLALTWGFLETAGLPKLSAFWTFACIDVIWGVSFLVLQRRLTGSWFSSCTKP